METNPFIQEITLLLQAEDLLNIGKEAQELKVKFDDFILEEERKEQVNQLNAVESGEQYEAKDFTELKDAFYVQYNAFKTKRNEQKTLKEVLEKENLRHKKSLIEKLQEVIENEENIGAAYNAQKEIHETWKKIGDIPRDKRDEIQRDYSRMLEIFFHNMKIYQELKDHDFHRNTQLKLALINQLEILKNSANVKDMESALRTIQNEWEEIGPVQNDEWEKLKTKYWDAVRAVYEKINQFYNERRNIQLDNLEKKKDVLTQVNQLNEKLAENLTAKHWETTTENLLKIQANWKTIGQAPKKENEEIWKTFRAACDVFFDAKKGFYKDIEAHQTEIADKKRKLIEEAKKIQHSTDWRSTSEKLIRLQKEWKNSGNAGQRFENKLWTEFRATCDVFFNARENNLKEQEAELITNLESKKQILEQLTSFVASGEKLTDLNALKEFADSWKAIGSVPAEGRDELYQSYKKILDAHYEKLQIDPAEKELIIYKARFESLPAGTDRIQSLQREKTFIRKQIDQLNAEINQMENNLSFFAKSKGADALRKEVDGKIQQIHQRISVFKQKLKVIPNE
jgi:hypothetical protein